MILVTGGTGLVGAHVLLNLLKNGESVRAIYRNEQHILKTKSLFHYYAKADLFDKINWIHGDVLDIPSLEIAFENINYVYHCAGFISFDPKDEEQLRKVNIEGTANIVNFCIDKNVKKLCHVSSIATLGDLAQNETILSEVTEWNPEKLHSDYAISKYGAEMEVWRAQQEGLDVVIVNPGVIFGPCFWNQGSGGFFSTVKKGMFFYTNGFSGYVAVSDVVKIMILLMHSDAKSEQFIVVAENISYKDIIDTIASKINVSKPKIEAKPWLLNLAWRADWLLSKLIMSPRKITKQGAMSLQNTDQISNEKVVSYLNYSFENINDYLTVIADDFKKKNTNNHAFYN
ncbi:MAG: NAD-dependent epimerase/dehydratase family protein [Bacteroidota bacterium]